MWGLFVQMAHESAVTVDGDRATAHTTMNEFARSVAGTGHRNFGRYDDLLVRTPDGWRFAERRYRFYYVDQPEVNGTIVALQPA
ncbi:hypothetical protein WPS_26660 [Vulcanimicrobium alpinum]|uniref:SnoaL-like domain-containing protein n=1 Tax=Vulcanimicrobium alpinum TaxID=3016050 RepID=A0AAN1XYR3_UNVUL|nr:nuclear transport factor 2 family protein [Vulcanimicrobium alpinum]BDE07390.1 hypothetical protein WPS_26660 [Vulcanimicrobium alpinum]